MGKERVIELNHDTVHFDLPEYDKLILRAAGPGAVPPPDEKDQRGVYWSLRFLGGDHYSALQGAHMLLTTAIELGGLPRSLLEAGDSLN
jgi:hypothetical protein